MQFLLWKILANTKNLKILILEWVSFKYADIKWLLDFITSDSTHYAIRLWMHNLPITIKIL